MLTGVAAIVGTLVAKGNSVSTENGKLGSTGDTGARGGGLLENKKGGILGMD